MDGILLIVIGYGGETTSWSICEAAIVIVDERF